jgi:hypothetical protein
MAVEKDGVPASGWAYTPDKEKTSTWKLNISDATHVSAAVAALGKGYRGNKVQIPEEDLPAVKRKVKTAYKKFHPDLEMPDILKAVEFTEMFSAFVEKFFGGSQQEEVQESEIVKSLDGEERVALFVVLEPEVEDAHGDIYSAKEIEKACNNFSMHCNKANLFHRVETEEASIVQSFITPTTFNLEDGRCIQKGTWLQWWHFPETELGEVIWKAVKSGEINGVSVGCKANVEELE